jgi:hypothetical protein
MLSPAPPTAWPFCYNVLRGRVGVNTITAFPFSWSSCPAPGPMSVQPSGKVGVVPDLLCSLPPDANPDVNPYTPEPRISKPKSGEIFAWSAADNAMISNAEFRRRKGYERAA